MELKLPVRSLYDAQKLRIEMGNRISAQQRLGVLSDEWAERLGLRVAGMERIEADLLKDVRLLVKDVDIWPWLKSVKGCGPAMSGVLISEVRDPERFENVAKLWAYCGLHVIDGRAVRRQKGQKASWNNFLKTKMIGVLGPNFLKNSSPYREHYDNYKTRLLNRPCSMPKADHKKCSKCRGKKLEPVCVTCKGTGEHPDPLLPNGCTKGHMHNMAIRYMVKMFLADFLVAWRTVRDLPVRPSYAEEYLQRKHSA